MKTLTQRLLLCLLVALGLGVSDAYASHFRYGTIQWQPTTAPNVIKFTVKTAWRRSAFGAPVVGTAINPGSFCFGDGQCVNMTSTVTAVNSTEDWIEALFTFTKTYSPVNGTYVANHASCCRISSLRNGNNDANWNIRTTVTVNMASPNSSPVSGTLPIVTLPANVPAASFALTASDPNGDPLTYSISPTGESGLVQAAPPGLSINSSTGIVTWNTTGLAPPAAGWLYGVQFKVSDNRGASIPVDVILRLIPSTSQPPTMLINNSAAAANFTVTVGQPLSFQIRGTDPENGTVTLSSGGLPSGASLSPSLPLIGPSGTTSTFNWTPTAAHVGSHSVSFAVEDNTGLQDTNTATIVVANAVAATATSVFASPNPANLGQNVTLTATVQSASAPAGSVQFIVDGNLAGTTQLTPINATQSQATFIVGAPAVGAHTMVATYTGATVSGTTYSGSSSPQGTFTVSNPQTSTFVSSSPNPSFYSQIVTFTATVTSGGGTPTGSVTFKEGATVLAGPVPLNASGIATFSISLLTVGAHQITAEYAPTGTFSASSGFVNHNVNKAPTMTTATVSPNPSTFGQQVTVVATVKTSFGAVVTAGSVTFKQGGTVLAGPMGLSPAGQAQFSVSGLQVGTSSITAEYTGNNEYSNSAGNVGVTVNKGQSLTSVTASQNPSNFQEPVTFTATVTAVPPAPTVPTGSVQFQVGGVNQGAPVPLTGGVATITRSGLPVGTSTVTALYNGDPRLNGSTGSVTQTVDLVPPPFTLDPPAAPEGACICTPLLMNTGAVGTQYWWVKASGGDLKITAIAHAVGSPDPETVMARVYDASNNLVTTLTASFGPNPAPGLQASDDDVITAASGIYRVEVTTPNTSTFQAHYRLKFEGAVSAGTSSPSSPSFEHVPSTWFFNVGAAEDLNVRVFTADTPTATMPGTMTFKYRLIQPDGTVQPAASLSATASSFDQTISIVGATPGVWGVQVTDPGEHYRLERVSPAADRGIYLTWKSAGEGSVTATVVTPSGSPFLGPVTFQAYDESGAEVASVPTSTGTVNFGKAPVGLYTIRIVPPPGVTVDQDTQQVYVFCDKTVSVQFVVRINTVTTLTSSPNPSTYGDDVTFTATVAQAIGPTVPVGTVTFSEGATTLATVPLSGGVATFTTSAMPAGPHNVSAVYTPSIQLFNPSSAASLHTVTPALLTVTAADASRAYGDSNPALTATITGFVLGETLATSGVSGSPSVTTSAIEASGVGAYAIQAGPGSLSAQNYGFTFVDGTLTVTPRPLEVTADPQTKVYGKTDPPLTYTISSGTLVNSDAFTGAPTRAAGEDVNTYAITQGDLALSGNYALSFVGADLVITKATLTVTANDASRPYGDSNPSFTASYSGFQFGQDLGTGGVTGSPALTTTADPSSAIGTYSIAAAGGSLASNNYTFTFVDGTLTIVRRQTTTAVVFATNPVSEGSTTAATLTVTDATAGTPAIDVTPGGTLALSTSGPIGTLTACTLAPSGTPGVARCTATVSAIDNDSATVAASFAQNATHEASVGSNALAITNVAPVITSVAGPTMPLIFGSSSTVNVTLTDAGANDTHVCTFTWDDGQTSTISAAGTGDGSCSASHTFGAPGVYAVHVEVKDKDNATDTDVFQYAVVYDPSGGFVTGGGFINSPLGAMPSNPALTGKANFGFVSKYLPGANVPSGQTEFQFKAGNLNFHSTVYEWLVVAGAKAQYKGSGRINNAGDYAFMLTATDGQISGGGGVDKFRIKIWDKIGGGVIYDNTPGGSDDIDGADPQAIGGGSIVIHKNGPGK